MLEKDVLLLEDALVALRKIWSYSKNFNSEKELEEDDVYYDAILMNFLVCGESLYKVSNQTKSEYPDIEWQKIKGFRNFIAHDYFGIDSLEVWRTIQLKIPALENRIENVLFAIRDLLKKRTSPPSS